MIMSGGEGALESQFRFAQSGRGPSRSRDCLAVIHPSPATFVCWRTQFSSGGAGDSEPGLVHGGPGLAWAGPGLCN